MKKPIAQSIFDNAMFAFIVLIIFGYLCAVTFVEVPQSNVQTASDTKECLKLILVGLIGWKWGSSQSSRNKDAAIQSIKDKEKD